MQNWIRVLYRDADVLEVCLNDPKKLDTTLFEKMAHDDFCLGCILEDPAAGKIRYTVTNLIPLPEFMSQVSFEKEEGYDFIKNLIECAIAVNRNKPVLFDPEFVFVSPYGEPFFFTVVPIVLDEWMFQKDSVEDWVRYLIEHFQTASAYEIPGFMLQFLKSPEFSLTNLVLGLENIRKRSPWRKRWNLFKKTETGFHLSEPVQRLYQPSVIPSYVREDDPTQIIGQAQSHSAVLVKESTGERNALDLERTVIGRSMACDIRLPEDSISLKHAEILRENDRYYLRDLKSKNRTYLNDKPVIRKMRLKDGMQIRFAEVSFVFMDDE